MSGRVGSWGCGVLLRDVARCCAMLRDVVPGVPTCRDHGAGRAHDTLPGTRASHDAALCLRVAALSVLAILVTVVALTPARSRGLVVAAP